MLSRAAVVVGVTAAGVWPAPAGGLRVFSFGSGGFDEVGRFIDEGGNNFWGVEFASGDDDGGDVIAASDRDYGLYLFRYTAATTTESRMRAAAPGAAARAAVRRARPRCGPATGGASSTNSVRRRSRRPSDPCFDLDGEGSELPCPIT